MLQRSYRRLAGFAVVLSMTAGACGGSPSPGASLTAPTAQLAPGPVTVVALGDSLTAGDGDDSGRGYAGRLTEAIAAEPGRANSTLVNLGQSGWDSTMLVEGQEGTPAQLTQAVDEVHRAADAGRAVLATVLIGSNDLWYLYEYGPAAGTPASAEDAAVATYRENLDRTVRELQDAGAFVVVGLPDDQSLRPGAADLDRLHDVLPNVTAEEVDQMSLLSERFDRTAQEVAAGHAVLTVDTNGSFWADPSKMADDGIHPNGAGYEDLASLWISVIKPAL